MAILENYSSGLTPSGAQTVQNKMLDNTNSIVLKDTNFTVQDDGDVTKQIRFDVSFITAGQTRTITFPDPGGTVVFASATQTLTNKTIVLPSTITPGGTTGNQTINKAAGSVNFAAGATSITVTNSLVTATSIIGATVASNDSTATIKNVVSTAGSFTITLGSAATAETKVNWFVF